MIYLDNHTDTCSHVFHVILKSLLQASDGCERPVPSILVSVYSFDWEKCLTCPTEDIPWLQHFQMRLCEDSNIKQKQNTVIVALSLGRHHHFWSPAFFLTLKTCLNCFNFAHLSLSFSSLLTCAPATVWELAILMTSLTVSAS